MLLFNLGLTALSVLFFTLAYLPIAAAREKMLSTAYPVLYGAYCKKVGWFIPTFSSWRKSKVKFRWLVAFQKEGGHIPSGPSIPRSGHLRHSVPARLG